jgi:PAT family beta-lactamase induction signal transducer AmpG
MPWVLAALAMSVAFLSASQDIVVDAYRAEVLRSEELGAGAAATVTGYRMALMASGAVALILSDRLPWHLVYGIMAALMLASACFTLFAPEPAERVTPPQSVTEAIWKPLVDFFARSGAISMLGFIMLFKLGDAIAAAMVTPFLLDLGFTRTDVGAVNKAFGLVTTLAGTVAGGGIIAHIGINRSLWVFAWLQALSNLAFSGLAVLGRSYAGLVAAVGIENLCGGMGTAAFVAFLMSLCNKRFTATQYALLSSLMAVARVLAGVPSGLLAAKLGWPLFFLVSALGALPGMALLPRFAPWRMR